MQKAAASDLAQKLDRLDMDLKRGRNIFARSEPGADRIGAFEALGGVNEFLAGITKDPTLLPPLRKLQRALADLERGKVVPMLMPGKVGHRPPDSHEREVVRSTIAAAMDVMMAIGKSSKKEAAAAIAKELAALGYEDPPGKRITAARVEDWRERMMTDLPDKNLAVPDQKRADALADNKLAFWHRWLSARSPHRVADERQAKASLRSRSQLRLRQGSEVGGNADGCLVAWR